MGFGGPYESKNVLKSIQANSKVYIKRKTPFLLSGYGKSLFHGGATNPDVYLTHSEDICSITYDKKSSWVFVARLLTLSAMI